MDGLSRLKHVVRFVFLGVACFATPHAVAQQSVPQVPTPQSAMPQVVPQQVAPLPSSVVPPVQRQVVRGPAGSQLVGTQTVPRYTSPFGEYLGLSGRQSTDEELNRYFRSTSRRRLVKMPEMFGDFRRFTSIATVAGASTVTGDLIHAGGVSGLKIGENNQAITSDRLWFSYNHMHDAFSNTSGIGNTNNLSVDRYLFGFERTFNDGAWSLEGRLPISGGIGGDQFDAGNFGDVSVILKSLLFAGSCRATSAGLGIELPTGDSGSLQNRNLAGLIDVTATLDSDAVHLVPFFASSQRLSDRLFGHLFVQLDIPLGDDTVVIDDIAFGRSAGEVGAALTASLDLGLGYWLISPTNLGDSGLAVIAEAHHTSRLGSADAVTIPGSSVNRAFINQGDVTTDVLNFTTGVHAELSGQWAIRLAGSIPVTDDQLFDTEAILQINRTY